MNATGSETQVTVTTHFLRDDGTFPNSHLPLVVYRNAFADDAHHLATRIEKTFHHNGWSNAWRDGIYSVHHYHSTTHEVLGCYSGAALVQFGGKDGVVEEIRAGDAVVIPAGVAHKNQGSSDDFGVVGAYPAGKDYDMNYGKEDERPRADQNIAAVPLPKSDPVLGAAGPLLAYWREDKT
jgi:uncharacterized protein YjlB